MSISLCVLPFKMDRWYLCPPVSPLNSSMHITSGSGFLIEGSMFAILVIVCQDSLYLLAIDFIEQTSLNSFSMFSISLNVIVQFFGTRSCFPSNLFPQCLQLYLVFFRWIILVFPVIGVSFTFWILWSCTHMFFDPQCGHFLGLSTFAYMWTYSSLLFIFMSSTVMPLQSIIFPQ